MSDAGLGISVESKPLDLSTVDVRVMAKLKQREDLMECLDDWVLFADRDLIPKLRELAKLVRSLKPISKVPIYRGFGNWGAQETNGFSISSVNVGDVKSVRYTDRAISFSTDIEIARAFGKIVVECNDWDKNDYLYICPELCRIVAERRNLTTVETQHEIIVLPPISISCKAIEVAKSKRWLW